MKRTLFFCLLLLTLTLSSIPFSYAASKPEKIGSYTYPYDVFWQTFRKFSKWATEYHNGVSWVYRNNCMEIIREYPEPNHVKITLNFTSQEAGSYRFTFAIDKRVKSFVNKTGLWQYELTYKGFSVIFDWSDILEIPGLIVSHGIQGDYFWFRMRRDNVPASYNLLIDPSVIATTTDNYGVRNAYQRKTYKAVNRYWAFFSNGADIYANSSLDGETWSSGTLVSVTTGSGDYWAVAFDGTYFHYAEASVEPLYYRMGEPKTNGFITWVTSMQTVNDTNDWMNPSIIIDSSGYPVITARCDSGYAWVFKSSTNDGTWNNEAGFPYRLTELSDTDHRPGIVALPNEQLYAVWSNNQEFNGSLYDGNSWSTFEEFSTSQPYVSSYYSMVTEGDFIHFAFLEYGGNDLIYMQYELGVGWGSEVSIQTGLATASQPVLSWFESQEILYCFWGNSDTIHYKLYENSVWSTLKTWFTDTNILENNLNGFLEVIDGYFGMLYLNGAGSPYDVKYNVLDIGGPYERSGVEWWMDNTPMWLGLGGLFICMLAPIMAFLSMKEDNFAKAGIWAMCIIIFGIPLIIGWLWG